MFHAITEMSDVSLNLLYETPITPNDLLHAKVFHSDATNYPSSGTEEGTENERLREAFFQAKSMGIRILLPVSSTAAASASDEAWAGALEEGFSDVWESFHIRAEHCILLGAGSPTFNAFMLQRWAAKGKADGSYTVVANEEVRLMFETLLANEELIDEGSSDGDDESDEEDGEEKVDKNAEDFNPESVMFAFTDQELFRCVVEDPSAIELPLPALQHEEGTD